METIYSQTKPVNRGLVFVCGLTKFEAIFNLGIASTAIFLLLKGLHWKRDWPEVKLQPFWPPLV